MPQFDLACKWLALPLTLLLLGTGHAAAQSRPVDEQPNILFVLLDNAGKDWFRCYGSQEDQTPTIDKLAADGIRFRNFYITPVCSTSRHMLLTGRYPFRTGWHTHHDSAIYGGGYFDWEREIAFARILKTAGYATCIAGKWQINDLFDLKQKDALRQHGFDEHCIFPEGRKGHPARGKRYWDSYILTNGRRQDTRGKFGPDVFVDYLIDYMGRHRDRPFLAYYSAVLTHVPVATTPLAPDENAPAREKFAGMVRYADHLIGRLVTALDELDLRRRTILVICCDNGTDNGTDRGMDYSLGGRVCGRVSDDGLYSLKEHGINVPFIVNCPHLVPGDRVSDRLIDATDVLPTLAALTGARVPDDVIIDGRSFAPTLLGEPDGQSARACIHSQYHTRRVVRGQRFKLYSTGEFYDLAEDPFEKHCLAGRAELAQSAHKLEALQRLQHTLDSFPPDAELWFEPRSISARRLRKEEGKREEGKKGHH